MTRKFQNMIDLARLSDLKEEVIHARSSNSESSQIVFSSLLSGLD